MPTIVHKTTGEALYTVPGPTFQNANLRRIKIDDAALAGRDLSGAVFSGGSAANADFSQANVAGAVAVHAYWRSLDAKNADMRDIQAPRLYACGADFSGADLSGANVVESDLQDAKMIGSDLRGTAFVRADLRGCDFQNADLANADLTDALMGRVSLAGALIEGVVGLVDPYQWMVDRFQKVSAGYNVHILIPDPVPAGWVLSQGTRVVAGVDRSPQVEMGAGVAFGDLADLQEKYPGGTFWSAQIKDRDLVTVVVPYMTNGVARCGAATLTQPA